MSPIRCRRPNACRAARGQVLVIFALASLVLLGALGLAIDGGYDYIQRRGMQNAADAAALAGTRAISQNQTDSQVTQVVLDTAAHNGVTDPTKVTCTFITNTYNAVTNTVGTTLPCSKAGVAMSTFTANYTGVLVGTTEQHQTFFFRALGITQSGAAATAAARVERPVGVTGGPFMVCGVDTTVTNGSAFYQGGIYQTTGAYYPTTLDSNNKPTINRVDGFDPCSGGLCKIVKNLPSGAPEVDPSAYSYADAGLIPIKPVSKVRPIYSIHAPNNLSVCNDNSSSFKGINTNVVTYDSQWYRAYLLNDPKLNDWPGYKWPPLTTGTVASISATVNGINGCKAGGVVDKCIMILPVTDNSGPGGTGSNAILAVRSLKAFYVEETSPNSHTGRLIETYTIQANSDPLFITGDGGVTVIKLIK